MVGVDLYSPDCACLQDNDYSYDYSDDYDLNDDIEDVYDDNEQGTCKAKPEGRPFATRDLGFGQISIVIAVLVARWSMVNDHWSSSSLLTLDFQEYLFCGILQFGIT